MSTCIRDDISLWGKRLQKGSILQECSLKRPMPEIGRLNNANSKLVINGVIKGLRTAVKHYNVPAIVAVATSKRVPYDLTIWPKPGALFNPTPINTIHWTNTPKRSNAIFWSRELNGWRAWPKQQTDKALGLARFANEVATQKQGQSWLAIATRATSQDGRLLCRWLPQSDVMDFHTKGAGIPAEALYLYPAAAWDSKNKQFNISSELLAQILGVKGVAS